MGIILELFMKRLLQYFVILSCLASLMCNMNSTQPPVNTLQPGKRNYIWNVDTLAYPGSFQTLMRDIYASSPKDIYVVGHNDQAGQGAMYHFDGKIWSPVHLLTVEGGTIQQGFDLSAIYGFSANNVWAVGEHAYINSAPPPNFLDSSMIIHFDGINWQEVQLDKRMRYLYAVSGSSPKDVWAGGANGSLYHFDGTDWKAWSFDTTVSFSYMSGFSSSNFFATAQRKIDFVQPLDSTDVVLLHFDGNNWSVIDSFLVTPQNNTYKFGFTLWASPQGHLYSSSYGVYLRKGNLWEELIANDWPIHVHGSSDENIFAVGDLGRIFHWNGTDWIRFTEIEDMNKTLYSSWTNNIETFIVGNDGRQTYIIHGK